MTPAFVKKMIDEHNDPSNPTVINSIASTNSLVYYPTRLAGVYYSEEDDCVQFLDTSHTRSGYQIITIPLNSVDKITLENADPDEFSGLMGVSHITDDQKAYMKRLHEGSIPLQNH